MYQVCSPRLDRRNGGSCAPAGCATCSSDAWLCTQPGMYIMCPAQLSLSLSPMASFFILLLIDCFSGRPDSQAGRRGQVQPAAHPQRAERSCLTHHPRGHQDAAVPRGHLGGQRDPRPAQGRSCDCHVICRVVTLRWSLAYNSLKGSCDFDC